MVRSRSDVEMHVIAKTQESRKSVSVRAAVEFLL